MKLVRHGLPGHERPALLDSQGHLRDLGAIMADVDGPALASSDWREFVARGRIDALPDLGPVRDARLGPCVGNVGKLVCMGINERTHTQQIGVAAGAKPTMFLKPSSCITGAQGPVIYPRIGQKMDWETELAVVIGQRCKYLEAERAHEVIAGYTILNDLSDRHWQTDHNGQFTLVTQAKSFDTFAPLGPWLVTPDEIADPDALSIRLWVNETLRQDFNSADYIYHVRDAVAFCSRFFTLYPGDVISMGSGPGNGFSWNEYLKVGDRVTASIEGLGQQEFQIVAED